MRNLILSTLSTIALLMYPLSLSAQNSFSVSVDVDGATGDQTVTSLNTAPNQVIAIEIFGNNIQNANGLAVRFEYDASQVMYEGFDAGDVLPNAQALPEHGTGYVEIGMASLGGQATANNGLVGTVRFRTTAVFSGTAIRLVRAELGRGGQFETITLDMRVALDLQALTPDFNGDGTVNFADFLAFGGQFGSRQGDGRYEAKYDLNSDGAIGFRDFLIFGNSFGKDVSEPVTIPDANLRAVIADSLGKAIGVPITQAEMASLTRLEAPDKNIRDLTGLEFATGLTSLHLGPESRFSIDNSNDISDLSSLSGLTNLTYLNLIGNNITDVSALTGLANLERLHLHNNGIGDVSALSGLTNLTLLDLGGNTIEDVSPLSGLTRLTYLNLGANYWLSDLRPLSGLTNLRDLYLFDNDITDVSPLSGLANLTNLHLRGNHIEDVSPLSRLTNLRELRLIYNDITNVSPLSGLTNLTLLHLNNNQISDVSALSGLTNLTNLQLYNNQISDVSALSGLTNLTLLDLGGNTIEDVSPLSGLANLQWLNLEHNQITDVSALSGLTQLHSLFLPNNTIADVSGLSSLIRLTQINLAYNNITDVSPLSGLINLQALNLALNNISDVSALSGLTNLWELYLVGNLLNDASITEYIPALEKRGVKVLYHALVKGDFDVELVFLDAFTEKYKRILRYAARRWMAVIQEDLPNQQFAQAWSGQCEGRPVEIPSGERIDDLRIYVTTFEGGPAVGKGGPSLLRQETHLPVMGCMSFDIKRANLYITGLHEIGHVLGFGTIWDDLNLLQEPSADAHFNGPLAIAAFDDAGGRDYTGMKVPVHMDGWHWRNSVFPLGELMRPSGGDRLSAITVQSLADLGYGVDVTQADAYTLPGANAGKPVAKIDVPTLAVSASRVYESSIDASILHHGHPFGQGWVADGHSSILGYIGRTGQMESVERFWGSGMNLDLTDVRLSWQAASLADAEPKLTCGAGLMQQPIYVVDPQGRVVRTIGD